MFVFVIRRLAQSVLVVVMLSLAVFVGVYAIGDPTSLLLDPQATPDDVAKFKASMGLDRPLWEQYALFVANALQGDFGTSFVFRVSPLEVIFERLPATLELAFAAITIAVSVGIPLGIIAGVKGDSALDQCVMVGSIFGFSLPTFWVGLMLITWFAVDLNWLPASGRGETVPVLGVPVSLLTLDGLTHILLPALNLSLYPMALVARLTRAGIRETMHLDFVKFAFAKGLTRRQVIIIHVLRYVSIPIVTVVGLQLGTLIAFAVVTESVFAWPGTGKLVVDSINQLDRPMIVAYLMITVLLFIFINLVVDLLYSVLDPRVRLGETT